ncbi:MAG: MFS transporter [Chloroflexi bacterium]|nr:MFS transporter [Chloroflexota bacterium]
MPYAIKEEEAELQKSRPRIFYGWWIVAAAFVSVFFNSMVYGYGMGLFYKRLIDVFGWTRASLAGAIALSRLEAGLLGGLEGVFVDKFGPKAIILIGMPLMGLGFILLSRINTLAEFYLIFILFVVVGQSLSHNIPFDTTITTWFIKRRGTAFGLLRGAGSLGGGAAVFLAWFIAQYGWRMGFLAAGVITILIGVPVALVFRRRPEYYGLLPDGDIPESRSAQVAGGAEKEAATAPSGQRADDIGMTVMEALKSQAFWAISFGFAIRISATTTVVLHAVPLVEDMGYSPATAAAVLGSIGMVSLIGRLGGGILNDIIGTKVVAVSTACVLAFTFLFLAQAHSLWQVWLFVLIYAPAYGASVATMPALKGDHFGRRNFGTILGLSGVIQTTGSMFGPVFAGYVYDVTKSYRIAFLVFAVVCLVAAALFMSLKRPRYSSKSLRH